MKVALIQQYAHGFAGRLMEDDYAVDMSKYDLLQQWSHNWDIEGLDLGQVYNSSLSSSISGHLWGGSKGSAKSEMLRMIDQDKEFVRSSLKDLFDDDNDLGLRVDRFLHHLDELYRVIKRKDHKAISHHHDRKMVAVLLTANFPEKYCLHDYEAFHEMMLRLEARQIPREAEMERYFKSMRGIYKLIQRDTKVEQLMAVRCSVEGITFIPSMVLMNDFMEYVVRC